MPMIAAALGLIDPEDFLAHQGGVSEQTQEFFVLFLASLLVMQAVKRRNPLHPWSDGFEQTSIACHIPVALDRSRIQGKLHIGVERQVCLAQLWFTGG